MTPLRPHGIVAVVALLLTPATLIVACSPVEKTMPTANSETQGTSGDDLAAAIANANPEWSASSALLRGGAGSPVKRELVRDEAERHVTNHYRALETLGEGGTSRWDNPQTGHGGATTVTSIHRMADGNTCKQFKEILRTGSRNFQETATACRRQGGSWRVRPG